jgi:hypothetical protein
MSSTYSNLGIELIGTGEQAGSWGGTTNNNLDDIIDNAIVGYVKVTLTTAGTSGSPNTLNVAQGPSVVTASDGQKRVIEVYSASDLGGEVYLQITPATFAGYYFIRNSLAGSRSLRIFQGTYSVGNTVLLANGYDAVIRCDGAATPIVSLVLSNIQGTVLNATNTAVTNDAATAVAVYPTWVTANTGNLPQKTTSASFSFIPSTGVLTAKFSASAGTSSVPPLQLASGVNLASVTAGAVEYDGTVLTATPNTSFKRATIPLINYTSGVGTSLTIGSETTSQTLLPSANDTITLPIGTYFLDLFCTISRGSTSLTTANPRINILGAGGAVGTFSGATISSISNGGASVIYGFNGVNINVDNVVGPSSSSPTAVYHTTLRGMLKITTAGTIIPQYSLSANLASAGSASTPNVVYFNLKQMDAQSATAFGPAGAGWG